VESAKRTVEISDEGKQKGRLNSRRTGADEKSNGRCRHKDSMSSVHEEIQRRGV